QPAAEFLVAVTRLALLDEQRPDFALEEVVGRRRRSGGGEHQNCCQRFHADASSFAWKAGSVSHSANPGVACFRARAPARWGSPPARAASNSAWARWVDARVSRVRFSTARCSRAITNWNWAASASQAASSRRLPEARRIRR